MSAIPRDYVGRIFNRVPQYNWESLRSTASRLKVEGMFSEEKITAVERAASRLEKLGAAFPQTIHGLWQDLNRYSY